MDTASIILTVFTVGFFALFIVRIIKTWTHRGEGSKNVMQLSNLGRIHLGPAGTANPGDPEMINRLEHELKKHADQR